MQLATVIGDVVVTRKDDNLQGRTLLILQPIGADGKPAGRTLVAATDIESEIKSKKNGKKKSEVAGLVGEALAKKAKEKGIESVVFDRGGFKYHGRVKAFAEAARKGGLTF